MSTSEIQRARDLLASADLIHSEQAVAAAVTRVAGEITAKLSETHPLVLCVMSGGVPFAGQLITQLLFPLDFDYLHVTRYGQDTSGGALSWRAAPWTPVKGRTVLLLDDILDEGHTLAAIIDYLKGEGAREVFSAVLVHKVHERKAYPGMRADFTGLDVADRFLFGGGMDYKGYWRNANGIYAVKGL